jgi:uncharacterized protein (TIGR00661 family)
MTASVVTECHYVGAVAYIVINFFKAPLRIDSVVLAPPVVRPIVREIEPSQGEHILLYSTSGKGVEELQATLGKFSSQKFCLYGFKKSGEFENCVFKDRSTEGFLADLASARGVIASAGFSLLSECLHFKKPMCLLPVAGQYEQMINAQYIEKLDLGIAGEKLDEGLVGRFMKQIDKPVPDDERILWPDNDKFFEILQEVLNRLHKPVNIGLS